LTGDDLLAISAAVAPVRRLSRSEKGIPKLRRRTS
jgi:hypothetical protein